MSQYFPPDKPGRIVDELSRELVQRGHSVRVVTTYPHYDTGRIPKGIRQKWRHTEQWGAVRVRRVPIFASHSRNAVARIMNYASFAWSARMAESFVKDADVVYVHGTPATSAHPAHVWSKRLGLPFAFHVQDIWPESVTGSGFLPRRATAIVDDLLRRWLRKVYASAAAVIAIAPSAQELFVERGARADRVHLVYNWARDVAQRAAAPQAEHRPGLTLLYAGNLGALQDLETVIRSVHQCRGLEGIRLSVAGFGVLEHRLKDLVAELGAEGVVEFLGRLTPDEVAEEYGRADFQIIPLRRLDIFGGTVPSKFQAGLAHALPVITTVHGDVSRLVEDNGLGFTAAPEDVDSLAGAIRAAYATSADERRALRVRARQFYDANLTKASAVSQIEYILESIARREDVDETA